MTDEELTKRAQQAQDHCEEVWTNFQERYIHNPAMVPLSHREHIHLNTRVMVEAIENGVQDLYRMAEYHLPEGNGPDRHKYAGFLSKWVAKLRPIYLNEGVELTSPIHMINAAFAIWIFRSFLEANIPETLYRELLYMFHFRDERGETLSVLAYCCEQLGAIETTGQATGQEPDK